jgi:hypothetical protein
MKRTKYHVTYLHDKPASYVVGCPSCREEQETNMKYRLLKDDELIEQGDILYGRIPIADGFMGAKAGTFLQSVLRPCKGKRKRSKWHRVMDELVKELNEMANEQDRLVATSKSYSEERTKALYYSHAYRLARDLVNREILKFKPERDA